MIAEIQVAPSPAGTAENPHAHVEAAIAVIQASGLRYEVGALGTTLEGDADAGLTEQDVARRIAEWTAKLGERTDNHVVEPVDRP